MFAYCNNNPVIYNDTTGQYPWWVVAVIAVCTIGGGVIGYLSDEKIGSSDEGEQQTPLTTGDKVVNTLIGASIGLVASGAIVATGGAIATVAVESATTYIAALGGSGGQIFAIGAVAHNIVALIIAPFFGIEMEPIEYEP